MKSPAATLAPDMPTTLGSRSISAVFWGAGGTVLRMLLQIGAQIMLARLLGPDQYGVFAIAATVIGFSAFFSDVGLAYGLIQKPQITERDVRFVFTWQVLLGAGVSALVWLAAGPVAAFFGEPRAEPVLRALSVLCLLNALAAPALNLLKREIDFKRIHIAHLISYLIGYVVVGVPLGFLGAGVWALVAAWLVQAVFNLLLLFGASRHSLRPLLWHEGARHQARYGGTVFVTNLVNWMINNVDRITVGRVFGSHEIGLYATAYNLLYTPAAAGLGVVQPVFFAASSRVADDEARIMRGYFALLGAAAVFALPVFVLVAVAAEAFIGALYGPQWLAAAALCRPIALAMPFFLVWGFTTPLLWTGGQAAREFMVQIPIALAWCAVCVLAAQHSVLALAWCVLGLFALRCAVVMVAASRVVKLPVSALWQSVRGGLAVSAVIAVAVALVDRGLAVYAPGLRFVACCAVTAVLWWAVLRAAPSLICAELAQITGRLHPRLPGWLQPHLAFLASRD